MTEQEIDAEVRRYEPFYLPKLGMYAWKPLSPGFDRTPDELSEEVFQALKGGILACGMSRDYPTREAAFADLRQAIRATGTDAA